jgi:mRNA-degrading endonuclease RelE of RelBE toxin-antitoxin system
MEKLEDLIRQLPADLQRQVRDFAQSLLERSDHPRQKTLRMTWSGALREYRDQYTSLDLQKKALQWRGD